MQYTPNYNLITVEGSDVVNPLVQMNPNFTDIDAAMFANKQASIGTASEITSGTVHAITRANANSNYFRFTATSNWNAGDSMQVDGVNVSVFMSDGTTPVTGSYVINSEVFAIVNGTRVTLLTSCNRVVSLDASDIVYDNTTSGMTAANAQDALDELSSGAASIRSDVAAITPQTLNISSITTDGNGFIELPIPNTQDIISISAVGFLIVPWKRSTGYWNATVLTGGLAPVTNTAIANLKALYL